MRPRLAGLQSPLRPATLQPAAPTPASRRPLSTTAPLSARLIRRPRRPYAFTQLVQLSDGSTYTRRTTSPHPIYRSTQDTRNHLLWQPSEKSLRNVELDEAGRLRAGQPVLGLALELRVANEDRKHHFTAVEHVVSGDLGRLFLSDQFAKCAQAFR